MRHKILCLPSTVDQLADLCICYLRELFVPESNGVQITRHQNAYYFDALGMQCVVGCSCCDWSRDDTARCSQAAGSYNSCPLCGARRYAVIYQDNDASAQIEQLAFAAIEVLAPCQLT